MNAFSLVQTNLAHTASSNIRDREKVDVQLALVLEANLSSDYCNNYSVLDLLAPVTDAGKEGIFKHNLSAVLGLAQKRAKSRLNDLRIKFNLRQANIQMKKQVSLSAGYVQAEACYDSVNGRASLQAHTSS